MLFLHERNYWFESSKIPGNDKFICNDALLESAVILKPLVNEWFNEWFFSKFNNDEAQKKGD